MTNTLLRDRHPTRTHGETWGFDRVEILEETM